MIKYGKQRLDGKEHIIEHALGGEFVGERFDHRYTIIPGTKAVLQGFQLPMDKIKPGMIMTINGDDDKFRVFRRDFKRDRIHLRRVLED